MKTNKTLLLAVLLGGASGCGNEALSVQTDHHAASPAHLAEDNLRAGLDFARRHAERIDAPIQDDTTAVASGWRAPAPEAWSSSWAQLTTGEAGRIDLGDWTAERDEHGAYSVRWSTPPDPRGAVPDAAVLAGVKSRLSADADVKRHIISVEVDAGTATLRGIVASPEEAGEAVRIALGTRGVVQVVSHLRWLAPAT